MLLAMAAVHGYNKDGRLDALELMLGKLDNQVFVTNITGIMRKAFRAEQPKNIFKVRHPGSKGEWSAILVEPGHKFYEKIDANVPFSKIMQYMEAAAAAAAAAAGGGEPVGQVR